MGKVKLEKGFCRPENVTISSDGFKMNTIDGYGIASASIGIKKYIKKPVYLETRIGNYSGIIFSMNFSGWNKNMFMVGFCPNAKVYLQQEVVNGVCTEINIVNPALSSDAMLGIILDPIHDRMVLFINGVKYEEYIAQTMNFEKIDEDDIYYNVGVISYSSLASEFTVNFGATPFKYPIPEGCISYEKAVSYYDKNLLYLKDNVVYGIQ